MDDRTSRRTNRITLTAEELDRNASMARSLNRRANNRLKLRKGSLDGHRSTNLYSLNYEMRRIKHELKNITHTSGHFKIGDAATKTANQTGGGTDNPKRVRSKRTASFKNSGHESNKGSPPLGEFDDTASDHKQTIGTKDLPGSRRKSLSLPTLPSVAKSTELTSQQDPLQVDDLAEETVASRTRSSWKIPVNRRNSRKNLCLDATPAVAARIAVSVTNANGETEDKLRPSSKGATKNDSSIANLNIDAVKDRIVNRLSQAMVDDESDVIPYMNVPPDGLPRTVYLLPPLHDLLEEANKARYIRRPKKPLQQLEPDDPERQLGIDEIFSKKR